ncbi:hypothetical protein T09_4054, partial [Trichinella sp. T9]
MSRLYVFGCIIDGLEIGGGRGILCEGFMASAFIRGGHHFSTFHCHINKIFNRLGSGMLMAISNSLSFHAFPAGGVCICGSKSKPPVYCNDKLAFRKIA